MKTYMVTYCRDVLHSDTDSRSESRLSTQISIERFHASNPFHIVISFRRSDRVVEELEQNALARLSCVSRVQVACRGRPTNDTGAGQANKEGDGNVLEGGTSIQSWEEREECFKVSLGRIGRRREKEGAVGQRERERKNERGRKEREATKQEATRTRLGKFGAKRDGHKNNTTTHKEGTKAGRKVSGKRDSLTQLANWTNALEAGATYQQTINLGNLDLSLDCLVGFLLSYEASFFCLLDLSRKLQGLCCLFFIAAQFDDCIMRLIMSYVFEITLRKGVYLWFDKYTARANANW